MNIAYLNIQVNTIGKKKPAREGAGMKKDNAWFHELEEESLISILDLKASCVKVFDQKTVQVVVFPFPVYFQYLTQHTLFFKARLL